MTSFYTKNLSVSFRNLNIIKNVNFEVKEGEFVAIVGKSGSGKSTFLKTLAGFIPFSGSIFLPKKISLIFQQYAVFPWLTVSENISFGLENMSNKKQKDILQKHLKLAELEDKKEKYPAELSGGQIQRVALARSLAPDPDILLMDEPYGALDEYTRGKMQKWLLDIWTTHKKTVLFVTHNIEEAIFLADRVLVLNNATFQKEFQVLFFKFYSEVQFPFKQKTSRSKVK